MSSSQADWSLPDPVRGSVQYTHIHTAYTRPACLLWNWAVKSWLVSQRCLYFLVVEGGCAPCTKIQYSWPFGEISGLIYNPLGPLQLTLIWPFLSFLCLFQAHILVVTFWCRSWLYFWCVSVTPPVFAALCWWCFKFAGPFPRHCNASHGPKHWKRYTKAYKLKCLGQLINQRFRVSLAYWNRDWRKGIQRCLYLPFCVASGLCLRSHRTTLKGTDSLGKTCKRPASRTKITKAFKTLDKVGSSEF